MRIKVEQRHIKEGKPRSRAYCPIAIAVDEKLRNGYVSFVANDFVKVDLIGPTYPLSKRAQKFIENFDQGKPVKPFKFNLKLPKEIIR